MVSRKNSVVIPARIVSDPSIMSGAPVVRGTRLPAETIMAYLRAGHTRAEIFEDYPSLPVDGIEAVIAWADIRGTFTDIVLHLSDGRLDEGIAVEGIVLALSAIEC